MTGIVGFDFLLAGVFISAFIIASALMLIDAPYGRHKKAGWGPKINTRLGWVLMESPASLVFLYFYLTGVNAGNAAGIVLLVMWQMHYVHRAFIYPFQIRVKPNSSEPFVIILMGGTYCAINGYLNGSYIANYAVHIDESWLTDPRFVVGIVIYLFGFFLNKYSDYLLRKLRSQTSDGYKIPYGFGFKYVSMPNYLGEVITWIGFAIAAWSLAGLSFVLFTMANLVPRAIANHRWYQETFPDYPAERRAIFPLALFLPKSVLLKLSKG